MKSKSVGEVGGREGSLRSLYRFTDTARSSRSLPATPPPVYAISTHHCSLLPFPGMPWKHTSHRSSLMHLASPNPKDTPSVKPNNTMTTRSIDTCVLKSVGLCSVDHIAAPSSSSGDKGGSYASPSSSFSSSGEMGV